MRFTNCPNGSRTSSKWPFNYSESPLFPAFSATPCSLNCRWKKACLQICTYSFLTKISLLLSLVKLIQYSNCSTFICSGGTHSQEYKGQHQCIFSCFCSQEACFLDKWTETEIFFLLSAPPPLFFSGGLNV